MSSGNNNFIERENNLNFNENKVSKEGLDFENNFEQYENHENLDNEAVKLSEDDLLNKGHSVNNLQTTVQDSQSGKISISQVENILEDGLEGVYLDMSDKLKKKFKVKGEKTAKKISKIVSKTKIKVKKIVALIKKWLAIIPGANKFFLEQEAKIKADEIVNLKN